MECNWSQLTHIPCTRAHLAVIVLIIIMYMTVNKRKRRASLINGVQGLEGESDDIKVVTPHEIREKCSNVSEYNLCRN